MSKPRSFEDSMNRLETIVALLEQGEVPLEDALARYEEGVDLVRRCRQQLSQAELKVRKLVEGSADSVESDQPADVPGSAIPAPSATSQGAAEKPRAALVEIDLFGAKA